MTRTGRLLGLLCVCGTLCGVTPRPVAAVAMGTAFMYQGRFTDGGNPADGSYDFEFLLFDAATGGTQQGSAVHSDDVDVDDGYFTVALDFGGSAFAGDARWLRIAVRPGAESGSYTTLTPRHEITPGPYALYAQQTNGITVSNGNVGIGTTNPGARLDVKSSGDGDFVSFTTSDGQDFTWRQWQTGGAKDIAFDSPSGTVFMVYESSINAMFQGKGYFGGSTGAHPNAVLDVHGDGSSDVLAISSNTNDANAGDYLLVENTGNVGIGTASPLEKLHVSGGTMRIDGVAVPMVIRETDQSLPAGLWRLVTDGGEYRLDRNTAAAGNFATYECPLAIMSDGRTLLLDGNVGIGTGYPTEKLDVSGTVRCLSVVQTSDAQLKTDMRPLAGVLDKLDAVTALSFRWNQKAQSLGAKAGARQIGVLAQELEQVFPELVTTPARVTVDELLRDYPESMLTPQLRQRLERDAERTHYKGVSYSQLTVVLLQAVKELKSENDSLKLQLGRIDELEARIRQLEGK